MEQKTELSLGFITETLNKSKTMHNCTSTVIIKKADDIHGFSDSTCTTLCNIIKASNRKEVVVVQGFESEGYITFNVNLSKVDARKLTNNNIVYINTNTKAIISQDYTEDQVKEILASFNNETQDTSTMTEKDQKDYFKKMMKISHDKEIKVLKVFGLFCEVFEYGIDTKSDNCKTILI
jgi:hypothetical protein